MKKSFSLLLALLLLVAAASTGLASTVMIDEGHAYPVEMQSIVISPFYTHTSSIFAGLSFSGGKAYCSGSVDPSGSYSASLTVTLYRKSGSSWSYVTSWSGSSTGGWEATAGGSISVGRGTYKVVASANVGGGKEYPSKTVQKTY